MFYFQLWYIAIDHSEMKLPNQLHSDQGQVQQAFSQLLRGLRCRRLLNNLLIDNAHTY